MTANGPSLRVTRGQEAKGGSGIDWVRLDRDLREEIHANDPRARERGDTLRFRAWWREDQRPSAYLKRGNDGRPVWGDSGTGERGGGLDLANRIYVQVYRENGDPYYGRR